MSYLSVLLFALSLACGSSGNMHMPAQDVPTPTSGPMSTDGPIWVAKRLNGKPVIAIWGTVLRLSTSEDGAGGFDGCNHFAGSHEDGSHVAQPDGTISFPGFGGTLGGCPLGMERQSENYLAALRDGSEYQVQGSRLEIRDGSGKVRLVMVNKSPLVGVPENLTGTAWRLVATDGKAPRGIPPTLAFWDEAFVGGTVADHGFVAQYDQWRTSFRVRSTAVTGAEISRASRISDRKVRNFLQDIGSYGGHAVREEGGIRFLRVRTGQGYPLDFEELMPAVDNISDAEWRLKSLIEIRREEYRYGGPPCVENVLPGSDIVARFTDDRQWHRGSQRIPSRRPEPLRGETGREHRGRVGRVGPLVQRFAGRRVPTRGWRRGQRAGHRRPGRTLPGTSAAAEALHDIRGPAGDPHGLPSGAAVPG